MSPFVLLLAASLAASTSADRPGVDRTAVGGWAGGPERTDTTFAVERGQTLSLRDLEGRVSVSAWDRDEVEVRAGLETDAGVRVRSTSGRVRIQPTERDDKARYTISVPEWMEVAIEGHELDVVIDGLRAAVTVRTGEGDIEVVDTQGLVSARSVEGIVVVERVIGGVTASSGDDDVYVTDVRGPVQAQTVDGDVILDNITADAVEGSTVDGDVRFSGAVAPGGEYRFVTHDGDIVVMVDDGTSASVAVSTFDGEFESDFPVTMERFSAGQELRFTLGDGSARMFLEAFDGSIQLRRR